MSTYSPCHEAVKLQAQSLMELHHDDLVIHGVSVRFLFAFAPRNAEGDKIGPAIKVNGLPAYGCARIINLKDRAAGCEDGEITLDGDQWPDMSHGQRDALLDHELQHFEVAKEKRTGEVKMDDCGRPVLKMRKHDFDVGWFACIAERHGSNSFEVAQAFSLWGNYKQTFFPFIVEEPVAA